MHAESELNKKTVAELKKIADEKNIGYKENIKKIDLLNLILNSPSYQTPSFNNEPINSSHIEHKNDAGTKFYHFEGIPNLPNFYGKDKLIFLIRDPYWGFVYWEMTDTLRKHHQLPNNIENYLRIYDISNHQAPETANSFFDIRINDLANNWYINLGSANRTYIIDLGYFKNDKFVTLLRSNPASTPRDDVSDQIDQEWMLTDDKFKLILQASGANALFQHDGSQELMKFLAGNVEESLSSGGASLSSPIGPYGNNSKKK